MQKKFNLEFFDYKKIFFDKIGINFNEYLTCCSYNSLSGSFNKDYNKIKFKKNLGKYGKNIEQYIIYFYKKLGNNIKELSNLKKISKGNEFEIQIDIYSPLFEMLSKEDLFGEIFSIPVSINLIEQYKLLGDFISAFAELDNNNSNYSSIQLFIKNEADLSYFEKLKIKLNQIKRLTIKQDYTSLIKNYDIFFKKLFSFENLQNNLKYLIIDILPFKKYKLNSLLFNGINNLKSLEYLKLSKLAFNSSFILNLNNLKELILFECNNIMFNKDIGMNLKKLYLKCLIIIPEKPILFPNLEQCKLENENQKDYNSLIEFSSLKKLKYFEGYYNDFLHLENEILEDTILSSNNIIYSSYN